jgi:hypothetical protein
MGEWEEDESASANGECSGWCTALLWIVPAKVEGTWKLPDGELTIKQTFQKISGTLKSKNQVTSIASGRMSGDQIYFTAADTEYTGRVSGDTIAGFSRTAGNWRATRAKP